MSSEAPPSSAAPATIPAEPIALYSDHTYLQSALSPNKRLSSASILARRNSSSSAASSGSTASNAVTSERLSTLTSLLQANRSHFHIEYSGFYSNHLPHALISLYHLQASPERLSEFYRIYSAKHLQPIAAVQPYDDSMKVTKENWQEWKGKRQHFQNLVEFMERELAERNGDLKKLLRDWLPKLIEGASAAALHPLIHTGFGMSLFTSSPSTAAINVTEGLAYMIHAYHALGTPATPPSSSRSEDLFHVLAKAVSTFQPLLPRINDRVEEAPYSQPPYSVLSKFQKKMFVIGDEMREQLASCDAHLAIPETALGKQRLLQQWLHAVLFLYACTDNDFFILHGCTGLYAVSQLVPLLDRAEDQEFVMRCAARFLVATFVEQGLPAAQDPLVQQALSQHGITSLVDSLVHRHGDGARATTWDEMMAGVTSLSEAGAEVVNDDHSIKLTWVCFQEFQRASSDSIRDLCKLVAWKKLKSENSEVVEE